MTHSLQTGPVSRVIERLQKVEQRHGHAVARCPAHDDDRPSLSITAGRDGRALLNCHAGCSAEAIVAAIGLEMKDLFPPEASRNGAGARGKRDYEVACRYDYVDAGGQLLYQVERRIPKDFRQRQPDGQGGWKWNLKGVQRVLYRLPEVLAGVAERRVILIVEGEKDVEVLRTHGFVATTNAQGAKAPWIREYSEALRGAIVALIPDNDEPGEARVLAIAHHLQTYASEVRIVRLPGIAPKGDVTDWLTSGHTADELKELVRSAPAWAPPAPPAPPAAAEAAAAAPAPDEERFFRLTDIGNAERMIAHYGAGLHYVTERGAWIRYSGRHWEPDETREVERLAKATVRALYEEAKGVDNAEVRKALEQHARASERDGRIRAMLARAQAEPGVAITTSALDADPWKLCLSNGTLDLRTGELGPHRREDLITRVVDIRYDEAAECPRWLAFLERVLAGRQELIEFVQRAIGYSLTGDTREQVYFFLYGSGANGKSRFVDVLADLVGSYHRAADIGSFMDKPGDGPRNDIARLAGARVVTSIEAGEGKRLNEVLIKQLTGNDTITARFLYRDIFEFRPQFKLWLAANHKPVVRGTDLAIWRRIRLIPFTVTIPEEERDEGLPAKLRAELPGILNWAIEGCQRWQAEGLWAPDSVKVATEEYRRESDILGAFLEERCEIDESASVAAGELYKSYREWAHQGGEYILSNTAFGKKLTERGFGVRKSGVIWRVGLRLQEEIGDRETVPPKGEEEPEWYEKI